MSCCTQSNQERAFSRKITLMIPTEKNNIHFMPETQAISHMYQKIATNSNLEKSDKHEEHIFINFIMFGHLFKL